MANPEATKTRELSVLSISNGLHPLLLRRHIPLAHPAASWPTTCPPDLATELEEDRRKILQRIQGAQGWTIIDLGLAERSDDDVASGAWNLFTAISQPVQQYRTGELVHMVEVDAHQAPGASHYSRSNKSGDYHTDGTLLDTPPEIAMLAGVSTSDRGGETVIVDGRLLVDNLAADHSSSLRILQDLHPFHSGDASDPIVMHHIINLALDVPVIRYMRQYVELGYAERHQKVSESVRQALATLDDLANDTSHQVAVLVKRGQALLWNNTWCLHGRRPFTESTYRRRLIRTYGMYVKQ